MSHNATPTTALEKAQQEEILELESQIRSLNTKISATVDHAADLQDELRTLHARQREEAETREREQSESSLRRMSTYFTSRRPSVQAMLRQDSQSPRGSRGGAEDEETRDLHAQLAHERKIRLEMEGKYKALQDESEVLSQSLFEEANKMVSTERKALHAANIKLRAAQDREGDRRRRLEDLEKALGSIQRARAVLAEQ